MNNIVIKLYIIHNVNIQLYTNVHKLIQRMESIELHLLDLKTLIFFLSHVDKLIKCNKTFLLF